MQEHRLENEIRIHRPPREVFHYVTQPWRWHEWHPASESATPSAWELKVGDRFSETVSMRQQSVVALQNLKHALETQAQAEYIPVYQEAA